MVLDHLFVIRIDPQIAHFVRGKSATMHVQVRRWWWRRRGGRILQADSDCILGLSRNSSAPSLDGHDLDHAPIHILLQVVVPRRASLRQISNARAESRFGGPKDRRRGEVAPLVTCFTGTGPLAAHGPPDPIAEADS